MGPKYLLKNLKSLVSAASHDSAFHLQEVYPLQRGILSVMQDTQGQCMKQQTHWFEWSWRV